MTFQNDLNLSPAILPSELQQTVWFLGALVNVRAGGDATGGKLSVLEHHGERGYGSPLHQHQREEETFLVLEGALRVEVDGQARTAGSGAVAFLPRRLPHSFVVTSPEAHFLTLHTPAGFEKFTLDVGTPAITDTPPDELPPSPAALTALAGNYGIEILGPTPSAES